MVEALEPWQWPEDRWRAYVDQVRAGGSLAARDEGLRWPERADVAVLLSFDSDHETLARRGGSAYSTSKAALEAATRAAALELAAHGIRVNAVAPGFIDVASELNPVTDEYARAVGQNPLGRPGTPEDVARAVLWIAGDDASWVTGETIRVDGGSGTGAWTLPRLGPSSPQHEGAHR